MAAVEAVDRPERPDQRVLHQVLGLDGVTGDRPGDAQHHLDLGHHVVREPLLPASVEGRFSMP